MNYGRWPNAGIAISKYTFQFLRNLSSIDDSKFEWIDYPGSALIADSPDVEASINDAFCLVLIVNGESFAFTNTDEDAYKRIARQNLQRNNTVQAIQQLGYMANGGVNIPPVAVVVTKRDLIPVERRKDIADIVHTSFEALFNNGVPVFFTSVTLGEEIARSGTAAPEDVEKPLFYALLSMLDKDIADLKKSISDAEHELAEKDTLWNRLINQAMLDKLKERIHDDKGKIKAILSIASPMLKFFDDDSVFYVGGKKTSLRKYFSGRLTL